MFSVVKTIEGAQKRPTFTAVPSAWVKNEFLLWPPGARTAATTAIKNQKAPAETWRKIPCMVKIGDINTLEQAVKITAMFANCSDTESEERQLTMHDEVDLNEMLSSVSEEVEPAPTAETPGGVEAPAGDAFQTRIMLEIAKINAKLDKLLQQNKTQPISTAQTNNMGRNSFFELLCKGKPSTLKLN